MNATTFDTLDFALRLEAAGMPRQQAEAFAQAQKAALDEMLSSRELATQHDLALTAAELRNDIRLTAAELKHDILRWVLGMFCAQTALLVAVLAWILPR